MKILSWEGKKLYEADVDSLRTSVIKAVSEKANLSEADLRGADLTSATLFRTDLSGARLVVGKKADVGSVILQGIEYDTRVRCGNDFERHGELSSQLPDEIRHRPAHLSVFFIHASLYRIAAKKHCAESTGGG